MRHTSVLPWALLLALLAMLGCMSGQGATQNLPSDRMTRIENGLRPDVTFEGDVAWTLEERMEHYGVPAVSIAVIQDFQVVAYRVFGLADRETGEEATPDTLFQAGSVSKPVAAVGALQMVAADELTLDGNINDTLTSWKLPDNEFTEDEKVTLTHLLAHTGGLTVHGFPGYAVGEEVPSTIQVLDGTGPANTSEVRVNKVPGESYRYSGGGYTIAQLAMVDAAGQPFPALMDELLLQPAGMKRSSFLNPLPPDLLQHAAAGYLPDNSAVEGKRHTYPEMAAAGLWTTAEDLARFAIEVQLALRGESDVIDRTAAEQLVESVTGFNGRGVFLDWRDRAPYFSHGGWDEGFCAHLVAHRDAGYGAAVMINSNHPELMHEIIRGIAQEYGWAGHAPWPQLEIPQEALELYPGRYRYGTETGFTIQRQEDRLFLEYFGSTPDELHYVGNGRYQRRERPTPITFTVENSVPSLHFLLDDGGVQTHHRLADDERVPREILLADGYEAALPVYREIFDESPDDPHLAEGWLNSVGLEIASREVWEPAIGLLRITTELYPGSANTYDSVGYVFRAKGDHDTAMKWYRRSLEVDPDFSTALKAVAELQAEHTAREQERTRRASAGRVAVTVRAWIDGADLLKVRGDKVWFEHIHRALPGTWLSGGDHTGNEPTVVNGTEWIPQWEGRISDVFTVESGSWPLDVWHVSVIRVEARGKVYVVEQANENNDHTFTLMLDDDEHSGAAWYEVQLLW